MKGFAAILGIVTIALFVGYVWHTAHENAAAAPYVDWKTIADDTFVVDPGQIRIGYQTPDPTQTRYGFRPKITVSAASPITIGFIPARYRAAVISNPASLNSLPIFHCLNQHVLHTTVNCESLNTMNESYMVYVKDERTSGQVAGSALLSGVGIKSPAEQALVRNDVRVEFSAYTCVRNCQ